MDRHIQQIRGHPTEPEALPYNPAHMVATVASNNRSNKSGQLHRSWTVGPLVEVEAYPTPSWEDNPLTLDRVYSVSFKICSSLFQHQLSTRFLFFFLSLSFSPLQQVLVCTEWDREPFTIHREWAAITSLCRRPRITTAPIIWWALVFHPCPRFATQLRDPWVVPCRSLA